MAQSEAVSDAKIAEEELNLERKIFNHIQSYKCGGKCCNVCLSKKLATLQANKNTALNKKSESTAMCRHNAKFKLRTVSFI